MPRVIYEHPDAPYTVVATYGNGAYGENDYGGASGNPIPQAPGVPETWDYIGATIQSYDINTWVFSQVYNRDGTAWVWLNAEIDRVDYVIKNISWDRATIDITDEMNIDFGIFHLTVVNITNGGTVFNQDLPDDTDLYTVTGLLDERVYEFDLITKLSDGSWTQSSKQRITTPKNPIPKPVSLYATAAYNTSINLAWTSPADSTAMKYNVYVKDSQGGMFLHGTTQAKAYTVPGLWEDHLYSYWVAGVNSSNYQGPLSNELRWGTGHGPAYDEGYLEEYIQPAAWGSYRGDMKWQHYASNRRVDNYKIQQGYWQADPRTTGTTYGINVPQEEAGRYTGCVVYDIAGIRAYVGGARADSLDVTRAEIVRLYRYRWEGAHWPPEPWWANYMLWHLTYADIRNPGAVPQIYGEHRNNYDSPDAVSAQDCLNSGSAFGNLRIPRSFGKALMTGWYNGTRVNGLCIFRPDHQNSGSGAAGYGAWAGHGMHDTQAGYTANSSDWRIRIAGNFRYQTRAYQAPYPW